MLPWLLLHVGYTRFLPHFKSLHIRFIEDYLPCNWPVQGVPRLSPKVRWGSLKAHLMTIKSIKKNVCYSPAFITESFFDKGRKESGDLWQCELEYHIEVFHFISFSFPYNMCISVFLQGRRLTSNVKPVVTLTRWTVAGTTLGGSNPNSNTSRSWFLFRSCWLWSALTCPHVHEYSNQSLFLCATSLNTAYWTHAILDHTLEIHVSNPAQQEAAKKLLNVFFFPFPFLTSEQYIKWRVKLNS